MQEYHGQQQQQEIGRLEVPKFFGVLPEDVIKYERVDIIDKQENERRYPERSQGVATLINQNNTGEQE